MSDLIQVRRGTSAEWAAANPVLAVAEPGYDTTTGAFKIGDGVTAWAGLAAVGAMATSTPRGWVAQAFVTTNQTAIGAGPSNMANYDIAFTAVAGRRYKFTAAVLLVASAVSVWSVDLLDDATNLGRMVVAIDALGGQRSFGTLITDTALTAGARTLHLSITRVTGTGTIDNIVSTQKGFLLVEDIGAF